MCSQFLALSGRIPLAENVHSAGGGNLRVLKDAEQAGKTLFLVDRRKRLRVAVHWSVSLSRTADTGPVESITHDISSGGFYCLCEQAFAPGDAVECMIRVPTQDPTGRDESLSLQCKAQVVRVERLGAGESFGIGCRIQDYRVVRINQPQVGQA